MSELGRQVKYGIGVESTPGTAVTATRWFNHLEFGLKPVTTYVNNESAWGNLVKTNSAGVARRSAEGSGEAKLTPNLGGLILALAAGQVSSATNADASGDVYDHTINIANTIDSKTATFVRQDSLSTESYTRGRIGQWELAMELDDYLKYTFDILAKAPVSSAATVAYTDESEFLARHFTVKSAATTGGLAAASNLALVQSFTLTCNPNLEADNEAGNDGPASFTSRGFELGFEMTSRYNDRTFENAYKNGTALAWQIAIEDTDATIGTSAKPKFLFTAPKVTINEWDRDEGDLDSPIDQTVSGTIHFSPEDLYALRMVVTNTLPTLF